MTLVTNKTPLELGLESTRFLVSKNPSLCQAWACVSSAVSWYQLILGGWQVYKTLGY